eukprot:gene6605-8445_t
MNSGPDSDLAEAYTDPSSPSTNAASTNDSFVSVLSMSNIAHVDLTDFFRLDNESSGQLEKFLANDAHINIQYVPPGTHRANKAERAIRH